MRLFAHTLAGDVRKWFRAFPANSIDSLDSFHQQFLNIWEKKKNPLQILSEYENIRRGPNETVQDYCTRFNNIYNSIPVNLRPPPNLALIKFPNGFDMDMAYQIRERNPSTLEEMKSVAASLKLICYLKGLESEMKNEELLRMKLHHLKLK